VRDYIHVADVGDAFRVLTESRASGIFNVCSGQPITIRHLLETVGGLMGRAQLIEFGARPYGEWEPPFICGDAGRLRSIGWLPRYGLTEGLRETIAWWAAHAPECTR
jgi:nucleoside-diphosphate-sugar epimerase